MSPQDTDHALDWYSFNSHTLKKTFKTAPGGLDVHNINEFYHEIQPGLRQLL